MLNNFFKLNEPFGQWLDFASFKESIKNGDEIASMQFTPEDLKKATGFRTIEKKTFRNISFSKTRISGLSFEDCRFEDCLFIGTEFVDCEFRHCVFKNSNLYKSSFSGTYVNPDAFLLAIDPSKYANIGVGLFQALSRDLANQNQHAYRAKAEFLFEKWLRYQLRYEMEAQRINCMSFQIRRGFRLFFEVAAGYGWKPGRLACSILAAYLFLMALTKVLWTSYGIASAVDGISADGGLVNIVYYTSTLLATLGPMGLIPTTNVGLIMASVHGVVGVVLFALLASLMFRAVVKTT
jgi:hypothetical protein